MKALMTIIRTVVLLTSILLAACDTGPQLDYSLSLSDAAEGEAGESVVTAALSADGDFAAVVTIDGAVSRLGYSAAHEIQNWPKEDSGVEPQS